MRKITRSTSSGNDFGLSTDDLFRVGLKIKRKPLQIHPKLLVGMVRERAVSAGRVWLIARALDTSGRGSCHVKQLRILLTDKKSPLKMCGWRRLRQILADGEGLFWERDNQGRLFFFGMKRVGEMLGVKLGRVRASQKISLPVIKLLKPIAEVRAWLFSAYHIGRSGRVTSRQAIRTQTAVSDRTQRRYDKTANVTQTANYALSEHSDSLDFAWEYGRSALIWRDKRGLIGTPNQTYLAHRLPNSYRSVLEKDLVTHGTQGNNSGKRDGFAVGKEQKIGRSGHYYAIYGGKKVRLWVSKF